MKKLYLFFILSVVLIFSSCVGTLYNNTISPNHDTQSSLLFMPDNIVASPPPSSISIPTVDRHNITHIVAPMETVWRISKMYDVSMEDIIRVNHLNSNAVLKEGAKIIVPNAAPWKPVIPIYPSKKWKYIIIHHSATDSGNAFLFDKAHHKRGFWNGLGYHFVIDNGSCGKQVGQIEVSPRWLKQQNGAHCKASNMNSKAIGICLTGNFSEVTLSDRELNSLVYLVKLLKESYNIPDDHIMGHSDVKGAQTECPGLKFPWKKFWRKLNS